jgi:DNA polymerase III delta prime subunit|tara:strand:+ start:912 stop:1871 length:960 start_codon:yes stop_codon:yes gene_type:complete
MDIPFIYKYKPVLFKDFEIDQNIITILNTLISMNNLNILFTGNSGSGKTSIINALIKEYYNNIPYDNNNILIINSLKDQGIQYYRNEVKTFCQTRSPIHNKKKIVVLDDIDNINEQSQQVFRNCIDKYSNNVHFISSCSNIQKVIDSLQSRKTIIKLKSLENDSLKNILFKIKTNENINIDKEAEDFILSVSNGSVRILLNYLEKFKLLNKDIITFELAESICTNISFSIFKKYTLSIINNNISDSISILYELFDKGYSVMDIYDNYFIFVKMTDILNETQKYETIKILCKYISIFHNIHEDEIELALFSNNLSKLICI